MVSKKIDLGAIKKNLRSAKTKLAAHLSFIVTILVLSIYTFIVWQINRLATAEPTPEQETATLGASKLPIIDKNAIEKIQALEESSPDIKSFFNEARNNPFDE